MLRAAADHSTHSDHRETKGSIPGRAVPTPTPWGNDWERGLVGSGPREAAGQAPRICTPQSLVLRNREGNWTGVLAPTSTCWPGAPGSRPLSAQIWHLPSSFSTFPSAGSAHIFQPFERSAPSTISPLVLFIPSTPSALTFLLLSPPK